MRSFHGKDLNETILLTENFFRNKSSVYVEKKLCKLRLKYFFERSAFGKEIRAKTDQNLFLTNKGLFEINFKVTFVLAIFMNGSTCNYKVSGWPNFIPRICVVSRVISAQENWRYRNSISQA